MGYAGLLEDIIERYLIEMEEIKSYINDPSNLSENKEYYLQQLIDKQDTLIKELLEIATNPQNTLIQDNFNLKAQLKSLQLEYDVEADKVDAEINEIYEQCNQEKRALQDKITILERKLSR